MTRHTGYRSRFKAGTCAFVIAVSATSLATAQVQQPAYPPSGYPQPGYPVNAQAAYPGYPAPGPAPAAAQPTHFVRDLFAGTLAAVLQTATGGLSGALTGRIVDWFARKGAQNTAAGGSPYQAGAASAYPGAASAYPGSAAAYPGATASYPGAAAAYPGATAAYPGATSAYPGTTQYPGATAQSYPTTTSGYPGATTPAYPNTTPTAGGYPGATASAYPSAAPTAAGYPGATTSAYPSATPTVAGYPGATTSAYPSATTTAAAYPAGTDPNAGAYPAATGQAYPSNGASGYPGATASAYPSTTTAAVAYPSTASGTYPTAATPGYPTNAAAGYPPASAVNPAYGSAPSAYPSAAANAYGASTPQVYDAHTGQLVTGSANPYGMPAAATDSSIVAGIAYEVHAISAAGQETPINTATYEFHTGDKFMVYYRPSLPGHMEIYNVNPAGQQTLIDSSNMAAGQMIGLGPYQFTNLTGDETLRLVLSPCSNPQLLAATRDIVRMDAPAGAMPAATGGLQLSSCGAPTARGLNVHTRDIQKVAVDGTTSFALDPVSQRELASGQLTPREATIVFHHR